MQTKKTEKKKERERDKKHFFSGNLRLHFDKKKGGAIVIQVKPRAEKGIRLYFRLINTAKK